MTNQQQDKLIDRLKKLLRLAKDTGATEAEAAAAMAKVHELLSQHNLDISQVDTKDKADEPVNGHRGRRTNKNNKWETDVYQGAAILNFCFYFLNHIHKGAWRLQHCVVGKPINVLAAEILADYLLETINRMAKELPLGPKGRFDEISGTVKMTQERAQWLVSGVSQAMFRHKFKQGMARRLGNRCIQLKVDREKTATKTSDGRNLPALFDAYAAAQREIDEWLEQAKLGLKSKTDRTDTGGAAFRLGQLAGEKVGLDHQLGTETRASGYSLPAK